LREVRERNFVAQEENTSSVNQNSVINKQSFTGIGTGVLNRRGSGTGS